MLCLRRRKYNNEAFTRIFIPEATDNGRLTIDIERLGSIGVKASRSKGCFF